MRNLAKKILKQVGGVMFKTPSPKDIKGELQRLATHETALYIREHMRHVQSVDTVFAVHDAALAKVTIPDGLMLEFGVWSGGTINHISSRTDSIVHGFDSFEGLPEDWRDGFGEGHFKLDALPKVRENVRLHKGWFDASIPEFLRALDDPAKPVSYLHVDCDLYSSTKTIFDLLGDRIVPGTVITFDEYFNYDGWQDGEIKAFKEFLAARSLGYEYLTYNCKHEQVAVLLH